jgi:DNA repair exonuclease SbcCD nuclease subunit
MHYQDSFDALDEILQIGENLEVDLALQSGDLFHDLYPTHQCICKTLRIFDSHVFGDKTHRFNYYPIEGVDSSYVNLLSGKMNVNLENKKVKLPIVGIHGNHDYPMKTLKDSAYEMLSITKCVTYIGRVHELKNPVFKPTIFVRDGVALVVYGIGYIKDLTLLRILGSRQYTFEPVPDEIINKYQIFKVLLFHQNRYKVCIFFILGRCKRSPELCQV